MTISQVIAVAAGLITLFGYLPYARDILRGSARPARSSRIMFAILLIITLFQQISLHSGLLVIMTIGEIIGSLAILVLALRRGVGGLSRIDKTCYLLLILDILLWFSTGSALLALHLSVLADVIAFSPTLIKTWKQPWTETPLFFACGVIAPPLTILAANRYSYGTLLFPVYLLAANLFETLLIIFRQKRLKLQS